MKKIGWILVLVLLFPAKSYANSLADFSINTQTILNIVEDNKSKLSESGLSDKDKYQICLRIQTFLQIIDQEDPGFSNYCPGEYTLDYPLR